MLLAHGTTELNADKIESCGYFNKGTYFLKLSPDAKLGIFGAAGFALRSHQKTKDFVELYCRQDPIVQPFKNRLIQAGSNYVKSKDDNSPGLVYVLDSPENSLDYHRGLRSFLAPSELFSTEIIPTSAITKVRCLEEHIALFSNKYNHQVKELSIMENDHLLMRIYYSLESRFQRLILGRK